ncbi:MAG: HAD-IA family hydrolase, partial [Alphaproteobacteria bacterium]|nr:HAD-IA family hydrolase [Alphaproteobacteria bacterium]
FHEHGTTLSGLMARHQTDPHHFLAYVHDIDMSAIARDDRLGALIAALPGRKLIYTNGDAPYARRILARLGLDNTFERIYDIHDQAYQPKPAPDSMTRFVADCLITPSRAAFFEDMARNLKPAKARGVTTIWINNGSESGQLEAHDSFIDYETHDLSHWLADQLETDA